MILRPRDTIEVLPLTKGDAATQRLRYVIQAKPGNERRVETNLMNQEIETFLPVVAAYRYVDGEMVRRIKRLFPNYLFARLDLNLDYYKVKWTRGS